MCSKIYFLLHPELDIVPKFHTQPIWDHLIILTQVNIWKQNVWLSEGNMSKHQINAQDQPKYLVIAYKLHLTN